jgi:hypothetical protein
VGFRSERILSVGLASKTLCGVLLMKYSTVITTVHGSRFTVHGSRLATDLESDKEPKRCETKDDVSFL